MPTVASLAGPIRGTLRICATLAKQERSHLGALALESHEVSGIKIFQRTSNNILVRDKRHSRRILGQVRSWIDFSRRVDFTRKTEPKSSAALRQGNLPWKKLSRKLKWTRTMSSVRFTGRLLEPVNQDEERGVNDGKTIEERMTRIW